MVDARSVSTKSRAIQMARPDVVLHPNCHAPTTKAGRVALFAVLCLQSKMRADN